MRHHCKQGCASSLGPASFPARQRRLHSAAPARSDSAVCAAASPLPRRAAGPCNGAPPACQSPPRRSTSGGGAGLGRRPVQPESRGTPGAKREEGQRGRPPARGTWQLWTACFALHARSCLRTCRNGRGPAPWPVPLPPGPQVKPGGRQLAPAAGRLCGALLPAKAVQAGDRQKPSLCQGRRPCGMRRVHA